MIEREDQYRFTIKPYEPVDDMSLIVRCTRCDDEIICGGLALMAEVIDAADEHAERCR